MAALAELKANQKLKTYFDRYQKEHKMMGEMILVMLRDQGNEIQELKKKCQEKKETVKRLMKQLKIKDAEKAQNNGPCKEICCGRLFSNYGNLRMHREGIKMFQKITCIIYSADICTQLCCYSFNFFMEFSMLR